MPRTYQTAARVTLALAGDDPDAAAAYFCAAAWTPEACDRAAAAGVSLHRLPPTAQTRARVLAAVSRNGGNLAHAAEVDDEICAAALRSCPHALYHVPPEFRTAPLTSVEIDNVRNDVRTRAEARWAADAGKGVKKAAKVGKRRVSVKRH
jgi:hypothetical protein